MMAATRSSRSGRRSGRPPEPIEVDVAIAGGGLAGLTAAVGLAEAGLSVAVVEREPILGGRARSWTDRVTGDPVHIGPHIFLSEYPNMLSLLDRLGTRDRIVWHADRFIVVVDGTREIEIRMGNLPAPLHFVPSLFADPNVRMRDLLSCAPITAFALGLTEDDIVRLDAVNALALLRALGVTEHFIQRFWGFAAMSILNVPVEVCSAGALLRFYRRLVGHAGYNVGFPDGGLGDVFAPGARAFIEARGGHVLLGATVASLEGRKGGAAGLVLADGRRIGARRTVVALPPSALRRLAGPEWVARHPGLAGLVHMQPCPYVSTYLWFDRKLTERAFWARTYDPNDLSCDFYDLSNIHRGWAARPSLIATNCIWSFRAHDLTDDEIVRATIRELAEHLPEAAHAKVEHRVVNRIPMAIHCPYPGTERHRLPIRTPVPGLYLAGDWTRTGLPSSMESACRSGWLAAEAILADEGRPARLAIAHPELEGLAGAVSRATRWSPLRPGALVGRALGRSAAAPPP